MRKPMSMITRMARTLGCLLWLSLPSGIGLCRSAPGWVEVRSPHFVAISDAGLSDAREVLHQFEAIREVFHSVFPKLRVDGGQPMIILALEGEESMKRFAPEGFVGSNAKRPSGIYFHRQDRDYAILRLDVRHSGDQPYSSLYHEYTHSIVRLNFASLPTWLNEGLADFYGATEIGDSDVRIGKVPLSRLNRLRDSGFLEMDDLLQVDHHSQHYNEGSKAPLFYSESWALVHYLLMDPRAKEAGLLNQYLAALDRTGDSLTAGREAFGDLHRFLPSLILYAKQPRFHYQRVGLAAKIQDKDFISRTLSPAEALLVRAEFMQRTGHEKEAEPILQEALKLEPTRSGVHAALGYGHYLKRENNEAEQSFAEAMRLNSRDFWVPFFQAQTLLRSGGYSSENTPRMMALLETSRLLNPDYAATHGFLSVGYRKQPGSGLKALEEAKRAIELDPSVLAYRVDLGDAFIVLGRDAEARAMGAQLLQLAKTVQEKSQIESYETRLEHFLKSRVVTDAKSVSATTKAEAPVER